MLKSAVLAVALLSATTLQAVCMPLEPKPAETCCTEFLPVLRAAYFFPTDHKFRKIYSGAALYSAEINYRAYKRLYPWASVGYAHKSGSSIGSEDGKKFCAAGLCRFWLEGHAHGL